MATPLFPWYPKLEHAVAPTESTATAMLVLLAGVTLLIAWKGSAVLKAAWIVYLVSP